MLRPPSLAKSYDEYVSVDPVFIQPPEIADDATDAAREEHTKAAEQYLATLKAARETGDWTPMLTLGRTLNEATKFTLLQIDRNVWREIIDRSTLPLDVPNRIGPSALRALLVRLALKSAVALDMKIERAPDPRWNDYVMASSDVIDYLDAINPRIVGELGSRIIERLSGERPL